MPRIPDEWIERVKAEVLVEELAKRAGVELRKVGQELMGRCPFHEDRTPSLSIRSAKNVFRCFGCGAAGTPIDWVKHEKGVGFREAVDWLLAEYFPSAAEDLGGGANAEGGRERPSRRSRAPELPCPFDLSTAAEDQTTLNEYVDQCAVLFAERAEPQEYVIKRGLDSAEMAAHFRFGYQDRTLGLRLPTNETKAGREVRERFKRLGLLRESGHAAFNGSLVIPTIDLTGNVAGIYGRKTRDDLNKHSSDKHLYLKGKDDDVFNEEAFVASKEIVLCESRIDALSFWRHEIRSVTACRGAGNFSEALLAAFVRHGIERCFIAFDNDEPGDKGAAKAAGKLLAAGVECFRVLFPKGMDANEVSLRQTPARKHLDLYLRSAEWMGNGRNGRAARAGAAAASASPRTRAEESAREASTEPAQAAAQGPAEATEESREGRGGATEEEISVKLAHQAVPAALPGLVKLGDDEAELSYEDRRYRVRGLRKCGAYGTLKINLKAEREGILFEPPSPITGWHMDNLDLCAHRQRQIFERQAAHELGLREEVVRFDLGKIVLVLEKVQEERIAESRAPKVKTVTLSEKETEEAIAFWKSPDLFTRIAEDYTRCGLVGELTNKIATYVGATSRLLERPLAIIIQSSSAAGKSTLMEKTLAFVPEEMKEKYTAVSGKSLFYMDETTILSHKILAIVEEEGAEKATYPLKILNSEGELVMASTGKDPATGKLVTKIYRVKGPVMIILTTTSVEIDPELENRCLKIMVDESRQQTQAIHELQRMKMTHEGHVLEAEREAIQRLHQNAQRLLRRIRVHNPYARHLTFVHDQTRTRRDHDKYLTLIETIALMHQHQRPVYRRELRGVSAEYVDVEPKDLELAGRLIGEIVGQSLSELQPQTRVFLVVLHEMVTKLCEETGVERRDLRFTRRQIRELTGWRGTQMHVHLGRLIDLEYVLVHRGARGNSSAYELLYAGEGLDGTAFVLGLVDVDRLRREDTAHTAHAAHAADTAETPATTFDIRGEEGRYSGAIRGGFGPDSGGIRPPLVASEPASGAGLGDSEAKAAENAQLPPTRKPRSYRAVVPTAPNGSANGNGHAPRLRFNLLRRPAITLSRRLLPA